MVCWPVPWGHSLHLGFSQAQAALKTSHSVPLRSLKSHFPSQFFGKTRREPAFPRVHLLCFTGQEGWPLVWENFSHMELPPHSRCCHTHYGPSLFLSTQEWLLFLLRWMQYWQCEHWVSTGLEKLLQDMNLSNGFKHCSGFTCSGFTEAKSQLVSSGSGLLWWLCAASPPNAALCCFGSCFGLFLISMLGLQYLEATSNFKKCYKAEFYFQFSLCAPEILTLLERDRIAYSFIKFQTVMLKAAHSSCPVNCILLTS